MKFSDAINDAMKVAMRQDPKVLCYGLGVDDPKRIFGTTQGLIEEFGPDRVFDMPTAENAMTGVAVGAALAGYRSVCVHQRVDFFLLAMDQLVNSAAKWHYMFGGQNSVPITIRLVIGRGWGQGPTHSQALHSWFAHVPGLKVVMPTNAEDAKGLLLESIFDNNPVIFLEHRWLHNMEGEVSEGDFRIPLGKARLAHQGDDVTIVSNSFMTVEALHAAEHVKAEGVGCDVVDLRTVRPLDWDAVFSSVKRTGRLLVLDIGAPMASVSSEIIARVAMEIPGALKAAPQRLCLPDHSQPTSPALTKNFYPGSGDVVDAISSLIGRDLEKESLQAQQTWAHDVPGTWFNGPF